jgi:hypothetical protein
MENKNEAPHILAPIHDPVRHGYSFGRIVSIFALFLFGSIELSSMLYTDSLSTRIMWIILLVCTIIIYVAFCRDSKTLDYNWFKFNFQIRTIRGKEQVSKYENKSKINKVKLKTETQVQSIIPWDHINELTGLNKGTLNDGGDWFFDLVAFPPAEQEKKTFNENLRHAFQALPFGCLQKTILISGRDLTFIVGDIEEQLKESGISPVRLAELYSIQEKFSDIKGVIDWIYVIHIGLSYTQQEERAQRVMDAVQNGYVRLLNDMGIRTVLIKDSDDMVLLYQSMLTGKMLFGRM